MDDIINELIALLQANGGSVTYETLLNGIDPVHRQKLPRALREAKGAGSIVQQVAWDKETSTVSHTVNLVGTGGQ